MCVFYYFCKKKMKIVEDLYSDPHSKGNLIELGQAIARITGKLIYIYDAQNNKFVYSSYDYMLHGGHSIPYLANNWKTTFLDDTPIADRIYLQQALLSISSLSENIPLIQFKKFVLYIDLYAKGPSNLIMAHHRLTPINLNKKLFIGMGERSNDTKKNTAVLYIPPHNTCFIYNSENNTWKKYPIPILSDNEKEMLMLSSYGLTVKEIAFNLNKSVDCIKDYRRKVMKKLNQKNILGAIHIAECFGII